MPVLEAILVALLVLTAVLFVTGVQRPLVGSEGGGIDLGRLSSQTLSLLQNHNFTDSLGNPLDLEAWVNLTMAGDNATAALVEAYLGEVMPAGAEHALLLSNAYGTIRLVPASDPGLPRNARAAEIPFFPHWGAFRANATAAVNSTWAAPGQNVSVGHPVLATFTATSSVLCIMAPDGSSTGPGGVPWVSYWRDGTQKVPLGAPYGVWAGYTDAGCTTGATYARVALRDGTATDYPMYGLRLVVWFGV